MEKHHVQWAKILVKSNGNKVSRKLHVVDWANFFLYSALVGDPTIDDVSGL